MIISKANWNTDGDNLRLSMPLTKVDKERRIVSGFASLDNVDKQEDQQARSSECQQIGGSSGGPMMDLSSGG